MHHLHYVCSHVTFIFLPQEAGIFNQLFPCLHSLIMSTPTLSILVTGSNQGLGFETAVHLSKHAHVHLFVSGRNPSRVQEAAEKIVKAEGCKAVVDSVVIDVGDDASINAGVKYVEAKLNGAALDVLVVSLLRRFTVVVQLISGMQNNAGISLDGQIETLGLRAAMEGTYAVNVFGTAVTSDAFLPLLKKSKVNPRIVNVGSGLASLAMMSAKNFASQNYSLIVSALSCSCRLRRHGLMMCGPCQGLRF